MWPHNKLVNRRQGRRQEGRSPTAGNFSFAGIADTYFAAVFLPEGNAGMQQITFTDTVPTRARQRRPEYYSGVAVGERRDQPLRSSSSAPRTSTCCKRINPKLEQVVDFGWFGVPRQAAVPDRQLVQRHLRPQLRLGHRAGHHRHQLHAVPAEALAT